MPKVSAILLSFALTLLSNGVAQAQYQDPRYALPTDNNDGLDAIYNHINAQARQPVAPINGNNPLNQVRDPRAYTQFMDQVNSNLNTELDNTSRQDLARQRDARVTQAYEEKKINDVAAWERAQAQASNRLVRHGHSYYSVPTTANSYYYSTGGSAAAMRNIDDRRQADVSQTLDQMDEHVMNSRSYANGRTQAMEDVANNLREQVLNTQTTGSGFGLQGVGTNLYVRQYGRPEAKLPPVHNAAARIVPMGGADD